VQNITLAACATDITVGSNSDVLSAVRSGKNCRKNIGYGLRGEMFFLVYYIRSLAVGIEVDRARVKVSSK